MSQNRLTTVEVVGCKNITLSTGKVMERDQAKITIKEFKDIQAMDEQAGRPCRLIRVAEDKPDEAETND